MTHSSIDIESVVRRALQTVRDNDAFLFEIENSEWSVAHRLAVYLEQLLPGWDVDCEYNRQGRNANKKRQPDGTRVRPDIVIHHRGCHEKEHNLLVVELKKGRSSADAARVQDFTSPPDGERAFQYQHGLTVAFDEAFHLAWFADGRQTGSESGTG